MTFSRVEEYSWSVEDQGKMPKRRYRPIGFAREKYANISLVLVGMVVGSLLTTLMSSFLAPTTTAAAAMTMVTNTQELLAKVQRASEAQTVAMNGELADARDRLVAYKARADFCRQELEGKCPARALCLALTEFSLADD
ncbi:hypothetical protein DIPPA_17522 [Diplonema papillatum]|nr:hypothetical protein DIPPA_17522 [Diplonema papillatum]